MGRQILLLFAKMITVVVIAGIAVALGWLGYYASGEVFGVGLGVTWVTMMALGLGILPLLTLAFSQFDVTEVTADA